ncbi:uncharacterized protein LOC132798853 [Drosophila nasuta]|uniref:uncharacterized protein LOC132798853 n=1 Tax=Drosophila nasuta TaxID=42062 RepID=UPI00295EF5EF|nr:uncharacterized protein LOC132798853 [Drosophila nasuta]
MSDTNDNACGSVLKIEAAGYIDLSEEIKNLMKQFGEQTLKMVETQNRRISSEVAEDKKEFKKMLEEKMRLLCGLNKPHFDPKMTTLQQIEKVHGDIQQQFKKLFDSVDNSVRGYDQHCAEALKNKITESKAKFDEFTMMPHAVLEDHIAQLQRKHLELKKNTEALRQKRIAKQKEYVAKYKATIKEIEILEKYNLEAQETLELLKYKPK